MIRQVLGGKVRQRVPGGIAAVLGDAVGHEGVVGGVGRRGSRRITDRGVRGQQQDTADGGQGHAEGERGSQEGHRPWEEPSEAVTPGQTRCWPPR